MNKSRLQEKYRKEVVPALAKEFGIKNYMAIPKVSKVVLNAGVGKIIKNKEALDSLKKDFAAITGQYPSARVAKVSVASFNIRAGMIVGVTVSLRGERMYSFLDRLFTIVFPRLRDFRGLPKKSFDKSGNYTLGLEEHTVFPEVDTAKSSPYGLEITIVMNTGDPKKSERLLALLGMPFEKGR